jgi:hypothetical protein
MFVIAAGYPFTQLILRDQFTKVRAAIGQNQKTAVVTEKSAMCFFFSQQLATICHETNPRDVEKNYLPTFFFEYRREKGRDGKQKKKNFKEKIRTQKGEKSMTQ